MKVVSSKCLFYILVLPLSVVLEKVMNLVQYTTFQTIPTVYMGQFLFFFNYTIQKIISFGILWKENL